jgi:hypothetical protein
MRTPKALENVIRSLKPGARILAVGTKWAGREPVNVENSETIHHHFRGIQQTLEQPG